MRQKDADLIRAIRNGENYNRQNLKYTHENRFVRWHGNVIAFLGDEYFGFCMSGWGSVTTRERLNALFSALSAQYVLGHHYIAQRNGEQVYGAVYEGVRHETPINVHDGYVLTPIEVMLANGGPTRCEDL